MQLGVRRIGPARPAAVEVPPAPAGWHSHYALAHDPARGSTLYVPEHDHHLLGPVWELRGGAWTRATDATIRIESPKQAWTGWFDPTVRHVVAWNFLDGRRPLPVGVVVDIDGGLRRIETTGDPPMPARGSGDLAGLFAFDPVRRATVCATAVGVWELGADRAWRRVWGRGPARAWRDDGAGAAYDAPRGRVVMQVNVDDVGPRLFAWDGAVLVEVTRDGLPAWYAEEYANTCAVLGAHPELGAVLHAGGDRGRYALSYHGARWRRLAPLDAPPPLGAEYQVAFDAELDGFVVGPGRYEPTPDAYPQEQQMFHVEGPLGWTRHGAVVHESPLDKLWPQKRFASAGGRWVATSSRGLRTFEWTTEGWRERVDEAAGDAVTGENVALVAAVGEVLAVTMGGRVLQWEREAGAWRTLHAAEGALGGAGRQDMCLAFDADRRRVVVWGGTVGGQWSNRTYFLEDGAWRAARRASPRPAELREDSSPDFVLVYDTRLDRVVRFGAESIAVLEDEQWLEATPAGWAPPREEDDSSVDALADVDDDEEAEIEAALGALGDFEEEAEEEEEEEEDEEEEEEEEEEEDEHEHEHEDPAAKYPGNPRWCAFAHDPATGITLVLSWHTLRVFRVDLTRCEPVGTVELPADLVREKHQDNAGLMFASTWCYDASARELRFQNLHDALGHYAIDLGPLFDRCAAERAAPWESAVAKPEIWLCLYRPETRTRWRGRVDGTTVEIGEGPLADPAVVSSSHADAAAAEAAYAERLVAARSAGYLPVADLDRDGCEQLFTVVTRKLRVADEPIAGATSPPARFGGTPAAAADWPAYEESVYDQVIYHLPDIYPFAAAPAADRAEMIREVCQEMGKEPEMAPMGFLLQVPAGGFLSKHAGVAVFCATGGRATEHDAFNEVRLLDHAALVGKPAPAPDAAVTVLAPHAIVVGPEQREVDRALLEVLGKLDPALVDRVEELLGPPPDDDESDDEDDDDDDGDDDGPWHGKLGGAPSWVQGPVRYQSRDGRPYRFLLQLDIDELTEQVEDWDDAGLSGVVYVFVHPDEVCAAAFWQYT